MTTPQINYTGIGSRRAPGYVLTMISIIARYLGCCPYFTYNMRSGGADGPDLAFELGVIAPGTVEIFLPWQGFNKNVSPLFDIPQEAFAIASKHHPAWTKLKPSVKRLMARNVQQVLGKNLDDPSHFVLCWTPDGCESADTRTRDTGGTGLAIAVASTYGVPVYNIKNYEETPQQLIEIITAYGGASGYRWPYKKAT